MPLLSLSLRRPPMSSLCSPPTRAREKIANLDLEQSQLAELIASAPARSGAVVVVTVTPGPFLAPWAKSVDALLDLGYPGEQLGEAMVDVLLGDVSPAGKLPHSIPNVWNETRMPYTSYPGALPDNKTGPPCTTTPTPRAIPGPCSPTPAYYTEKMLTGYRWYDAHGVKPLFPFGHGLSYPPSNILRSAFLGVVHFTLSNEGRRVAEVPQLYAAAPKTSNDGAAPFCTERLQHVGPRVASPYHLPLD